MRGLAVLIAALAAAVAAAPAHALPELRISMPSQPYDGQYAPVYVDAFQEPGRVLYRFDALIHNDGTALDLYREADGSVHQALWPEGQPTEEQLPGERPPAGVPTAPAGPGARMAYVVEQTHEHFHFITAARYELLVPGAAPRASGKIGFCMFDSFDIPGGTAAFFRPDRPWCQEADPGSGFVRMGLSPGAADRYSSQREFQYVDVTGLAPGAYRLRGVANPEGHVLEDDGVPAVTEEERTIPGVEADPAAIATTAGAPAAADVRARAVAPGIPARRAASCTPRAGLDDCYARISAGTPLAYAVASGPAHGAAGFDGARLTYVPAAGFAGADRLTYTATDGRGLTSAPAAVDVQVGAAPPGASPPAVTVAEPAARRLLRIGRVRRSGRRMLRVRLLCRPAAAGSCAGVLEARLAGRRAGRRRFSGLAAGRRRTVLIRLRRGPAERRVVLRARVRDEQGAGVTARRVLRRVSGT